ncbi:MAG: hypothetical protein AB9880_04620 [Christensenellales bacterium]
MSKRDLQDYVPSPDARGGYLYKGAYYVPRLQGKALLRQKLLLCLLSALLLLLLYVIGRLDTPGLRQLYVMLPFLALLFFCGRAFFSALSLLMWKDAMTLRQYKQSHGPLKNCLRIAPYVCGALLLAQGLFLLLGGSFSREWPAMILVLLVASLDVFALHLTDKCGVLRQAQGDSQVQDVLISGANQDA